MRRRDKEHAKKILRLVSILNRLETAGKVSPRELAKDFNVTVRTAQRDLELINLAQFPLVSLDKGSYSFVQGFSLKRLPLTGEEASLLAFLCEVTRSMGGTFAASFKSLAAKAMTSGGGGSPFHAIPAVTPRADFPAMSDVKAAIEECREIAISYANGKSYRLRPLKIVFGEGFWYLFAGMRGRTYYPTFRLDRIKSVELLEGTFEPPKKLERLLAGKTNIWSGSRESRVVLRVDAGAAEYFKAAIYFPAQRTVKTLRDGALILEARVSHFMQVIPVIQRWIPHVHVVRPRRLREEIRTSVRGYLDAWT